MGSSITPMIHVPDVLETAGWYETLGFKLVSWHACETDALGTGPLPSNASLDWALLRWGDDGVMLSAGGVRSDAKRRDVDLYIHLNPASEDQGVDALFAGLKDKAEVIEQPYDAFHGNREPIIRDLNGFWITFAEPIRVERV